jgi:peptidyl-dipeptidase Dcp
MIFRLDKIAMNSSNQHLFQAFSSQAFGLPDFSRISPDSFEEAFAASILTHKSEIENISQNPKTPTFENTIEALEIASLQIDNLSNIFWNLASAHTNTQLQNIEPEIARILSRHHSDISSNLKLFKRIEYIHHIKKELDLNTEQTRVLELYYKSFIRSGANLSMDSQRRLAEILEELASLTVQFSQNILAEEAEYMLLLDRDDLTGLNDNFIQSCAKIAEERGKSGKYAITLSRSSAETFLQSSENRDHRKTIFEAWTKRGDNKDANNSIIIKRILTLRKEQAELLGYSNFADYKLENTMARQPETVYELLFRVWEPALKAARKEQEILQNLAREHDQHLHFAAHDWRHYAELRRKNEYDLDQGELRKYFKLENIIEAAFYVAQKLFGLTFRKVDGLNLYHEDVIAYEALNENGEHLALFLGDYFSRSSKRGGAWMSSLRCQQKLTGNVRPIILNVMNFTKAANLQPTLLSIDDAKTLFHEFGHALHGMLSNVTYPLVSGTNVQRDFVELPSQLFEHWLLEPEVLQIFAKHCETDEPISAEVISRIIESSKLNQGFNTIEFCASALIDMKIHQETDLESLDLNKFETDQLNLIGMPDAIVMRHRLSHFAHIFSGDGYSAGYYSYLWAETLDADAFEAFRETSDIFNSDISHKLKKYIYEAGGTQDATTAYINFRGSLPTSDPLLRQKGFS